MEGALDCCSALGCPVRGRFSAVRAGGRDTEHRLPMTLMSGWASASALPEFLPIAAASPERDYIADAATALAANDRQSLGG